MVCFPHSDATYTEICRVNSDDEDRRFAAQRTGSQEDRGLRHDEFLARQNNPRLVLIPLSGVSQHSSLTRRVLKAV